jgi:hypothetical protein
MPKKSLLLLLFSQHLPNMHFLKVLLANENLTVLPCYGVGVVKAPQA